jgi:hypothetical protein
MSFSQPIDRLNLRSDSATESRQRDSDTSSAGLSDFDDSTVDYYRRRNQILANTHRTEWWMAIAVLLIITSVGLAIF